MSLAAGVLPEFDPPTAVDAAAEAGWEGVGIWFDPATWSSARTIEVQRRLDATGISALDIEPVFITADGDHGDELVDVAAELGVPNVLTVGRGVDVDTFARRFGELCDRAAPHGVSLSVECGRLFSIPDVAAALRVLALVDRPNAGVLLDNIHLDRAGTSAAEIAQLDPKLIRYAQLCDAPVSPRGQSSADLRTDAVDDRCNLDEGGLAWRAFVDVLPVGTPLSLEIRSAALRATYPSPVERARAVLAATTVAFGS